ncbi:hypothetical protein [Bradyrhizobium genosp. P]|uniref:hypothetical protein n=1 Tax=Bradyrhizobium genosp. P TaxID=83641 RepID=UPI003CEECB5E
MTIQTRLFYAIAVSGFAAFVASAPAQALTMQECSAKYKAAKTDGSLNGAKWNDFRKTQCSAEATPAAAPAAPPPVAAAPAPAPAAPKEAKREAAPAAAPAPVGNAVFPNAVDPKYSQLSAGKQRFKTCDDQYNANKATGGNGGMKWIQKGGGYYSECNKHLKGA